MESIQQVPKHEKGKRTRKEKSHGYNPHPLAKISIKNNRFVPLKGGRVPEKSVSYIKPTV